MVKFIFILVKQLNTNLIANSACAAMIIEDEKEAKTIFARQRVSFVAQATHDVKMMERLRTMDFSFLNGSVLEEC